MATLINWCDEVWNPTVGCTRVSEGCRNCYIERTMPMRVAGQRFDHEGIGATTGVTLYPERLDKPLRRRKPTRYFVNSMSDLFHASIPDPFIGSVFDVMGRCPQHTFLVLTKRPARARSLLRWWERNNWTWRRLDELWCGPIAGPLPNVHLGVSAEDQATANMRLPTLLRTPAAVRWVSAEPLLGPVRLQDALPQGTCGIDWVVIGGESGSGARRMDLDWATDLAHEARSLGCAVWTKQLGAVTARELGVPKTGERQEDLPKEIRMREMP